MKINKIELFIVSLIIIYAIVACFLYSLMPATIATHWNVNGVADGFTSKLWGIVILPIFFVILLIIYSLFTRSDFFKNINLRRQLDTTIVLSMLFIFYISILSLVYNSGIIFNMSYFIVPATSALFIAIGFILRNIKERNLFFGIRTPWTIVDDAVWEKTHKLSGWLFIGLGIITFFSLFFLKYFTTIFFIAIVSILLVTMIYSYIIYKRIHKNKK